MKLWSLTLEKKNDLLKKRDEKQAELDILKKKTPSDLWQIDLDALLAKVITFVDLLIDILSLHEYFIGLLCFSSWTKLKN